MYRLLQYKHWILPNFELKDFPEYTFTPCNSVVSFSEKMDKKMLIYKMVINLKSDANIFSLGASSLSEKYPPTNF